MKKKILSVITAVMMTVSSLASLTAYADGEPTVVCDWNVEFDSLPTGNITQADVQAVKSGWDRIAFDYNSGVYPESSFSITDGALKKASGDKSLKLLSSKSIKNGMFVQFYPPSANTVLSPTQVIKISFDMALSDKATSRYVIFRGNGNSDALNMIQTRGDGIQLMELSPLFAYNVNQWYHFDFEIQPGSGDAGNTKANAWIDGKLAIKEATISKLDQGVFQWFYLWNDTWQDAAIDGEETYFDNFSYSVTENATLSSPEFTYDPENIISQDFSTPPGENEYPQGIGGSTSSSEGYEAQTLTYVAGVAGRSDTDYSMKIGSVGAASSTAYGPFLNMQPKDLDKLSSTRQVGAGVSVMIDDAAELGRYRMQFIDTKGTWYSPVTIFANGDVKINGEKTLVAHVNQGEWVRIDVLYNPSDNTCDIYIDGVLVGENIVTTLANNFGRYRMDYYIGSQTEETPASAFYIDDIDLYTLDYKEITDSSAVSISSKDSDKVIVSSENGQIRLNETMTADELLTEYITADNGGEIAVYTDKDCTVKLEGSDTLTADNVLVVNKGGIYAYWNFAFKGSGYEFAGISAKSNGEATEEQFGAGTFEVTAVFNTYEPDIDAVVVIAQYDAEGNLVKTALSNDVVVNGVADGYTLADASLNVSFEAEEIENSEIKVFVWNPLTLVAYTEAAHFFIQA